MEDQYPTFPNRLFYYRKKRGLTQRELADLIGLKDAKALSSYERGSKTPSLVRVLQLAAALNTPVEFLFADTWHEIKRDVVRRREKRVSATTIR